MEKKKKKKIAKGWSCAVTYTKEDKITLKKKLDANIRKETEFLYLLRQKIDLEKQLSIIRVKIMEICEKSSRQSIKAYDAKLKSLNL